MSYIEQLRERRKELAKGRHIDLPVPGYRGMLICRFVPVEWKQIKAINTRASQDQAAEAELFQQIDTLVRATERMFFKTENGALVDLGDMDGEVPEGETPPAVAWDRELAAILGIDLDDRDTTREVMRKVFDNDVAIAGLYSRLGIWMQNTDAQINEEMDEGEFGATPASL